MEKYPSRKLSYPRTLSFFFQKPYSLFKVLYDLRNGYFLETQKGKKALHMFFENIFFEGAADMNVFALDVGSVSG